MRKFVLALSVFIILCLGFYLFVPLNLIFNSSEILQIDIPESVSCPHQYLNLEGRERTHYMYLAIFEAQPEPMKVFLNSLSLKKEKATEYQGTINIHKISILDWWTPPSVCSNEEFDFFSNGVYSLSEEKELVKIQAELKNGKLYLIQIGNIWDLRRKIKKKSKFKWLFI